jgi:hypothetical protein
VDQTSYLTDRELQQIERDHPDGLTSRQIVDLFESRGERFSEATFRKYVQLGLLPRSVRVGRKGKHQGSCGLYPATIIRRVQAVKRMMAEGHTIEDIQRSFVRFKDEIEALERGLRSLFTGFERELKAPHFDVVSRRNLARDLSDAKKTAADLVRRIVGIERGVSRPLEDDEGRFGASGGAGAGVL